MLEVFYPDLIYNSIYDIDLQALKNLGIAGLILDVDNTMVEPGEREPNNELLEWLNKVRGADLSMCILSNAGRKRVASFASGLGIFAISHAGKPSRKGFKKAMRLMGLDCDTVCMIGDQLFTDVYGAKKNGIYAIYVRPFVLWEVFTVMLKRIPEYFVLRSYFKRQE